MISLILYISVFSTLSYLNLSKCYIGEPRQSILDNIFTSGLTKYDLEKLSIKSHVEEDVKSFEMIRLISRFFEHFEVLYFAEIVIPSENYGERAEIKMLICEYRF